MKSREILYVIYVIVLLLGLIASSVAAVVYEAYLVSIVLIASIAGMFLTSWALIAGILALCEKINKSNQEILTQLVTLQKAYEKWQGSDDPAALGDFVRAAERILK